MAVRHARGMLADNRALEEEAERYNPVNPKTKLGARRGRTTLVLEGDEYTGMGATPSAGVSQFRGGATGLPGVDDMEGGRKVGAGKLVITHGGKKASEAHEMGAALSTHLRELHGGGFFDDFKQGFMSVLGPVASIGKAILPLAGPEGMAASAVMNAIGLGKKPRASRSRRGGKTGCGNTVFPGGEAVSATTGSGLLGQDGHGQRQVGAGGTGQSHSQFYDDEMAGCGTGAGKGGRAARAALVKKVMAERGVKMIEASKIVKAEGLY